MEEWLRLATKDTVVIIDAMALVVVAFGTAEAFFNGLLAPFRRRRRSAGGTRRGCIMGAG